MNLFANTIICVLSGKKQPTYKGKDIRDIYKQFQEANRKLDRLQKESTLIGKKWETFKTTFLTSDWEFDPIKKQKMLVSKINKEVNIQNKKWKDVKGAFKVINTYKVFLQAEKKKLSKMSAILSNKIEKSKDNEKGLKLPKDLYKNKGKTVFNMWSNKVNQDINHYLKKSKADINWDYNYYFAEQIGKSFIFAHVYPLKNIPKSVGGVHKKLYFILYQKSNEKPVYLAMTDIKPTSVVGLKDYVIATKRDIAEVLSYYSSKYNIDIWPNAKKVKLPRKRLKSGTKNSWEKELDELLKVR